MADYWSQFALHNDWTPRDASGNLAPVGFSPAPLPAMQGMPDTRPVMQGAPDPSPIMQGPGSDFGMKPYAQDFTLGGGPQTISGVAGGTGPARQAGPIQQQMQQNGGFYAPPAITGGPAMTSPMNPGQQSGMLGSPMVQMRGPDGSMQFVDPQHVQHYQGLGAQVTGEQLTGSSYGGGNG